MSARPLKRALLLLLMVDLGNAVLLALAVGAGENAQAYVYLAVTAAASVLATGVLIVTHWRNPTAQVCIVIHAAFCFWYLVPMLADGYDGRLNLDGKAYDVSPTAVVMKAAMAVFIVRVLYSAIYLTDPIKAIRPRRQTPPQMPKQLVATPEAKPSVWWVALFIGLGALPLWVYGESASTNILAGRDGGVLNHSVHSDERTTILILLFFLIAGCMLASYLAAIAERKRDRAAHGLIAVVSGVVCLTSIATRSLLLQLWMPALQLYFVFFLRRVRAKTIVSIFVLLIGFSYLADLVVNLRNYGFHLEAWSRAGELSGRNLTDNRFFVELVYCMQLVPDEIDFSYESPLMTSVLGVVPRVLWPQKPGLRNFEYVMRARMNRPAGDLWGNILPGIIGQYWEVSGWLGIGLLGVWLGVVVRALDRSACENKSARYGVLLVAWSLFVSFRNLAPQNFVGALSCIGAIWLVRRRRRLGACAAADITGRKAPRRGS